MVGDICPGADRGDGECGDRQVGPAGERILKALDDLITGLRHQHNLGRYGPGTTPHGTGAAEHWLPARSTTTATAARHRAGCAETPVRIHQDISGESMTNLILEQRELGRRLRALRKDAGLSQSAAARAIDVSAQTIGRIEAGRSTKTSTLHVSELCNTYQADDQQRAIVLALAHDLRAARETRGSRSCHGVSTAMAGFVDRLELEQAANAITLFADSVLPGLLRTPDYHHVIRATRHPQDSAADLECWDRLTPRRWKRLRDNNFQVHVHLLQSVLHHWVGSAALMADQLAHLEQISQLPNISLRIIPSNAGSHVGLHLGGFTLLEFDTIPGISHVDAPVVYAKGFPEDLRIKGDSDIDQYRTALAQLDRVALSPDESRTLMDKITSDYRARITLASR